MTKDKRVEVLFEPSDYERLQEVAHREGKAVGAMIREAVAKYVTEPSDERRRQAFKRLLSMNSGIDWGSPEDMKEELARAQYEAITKSLNIEETSAAQDK